MQKSGPENIPDYAMITAPPIEERLYARSDPLFVQRLALGVDLCIFYGVLATLAILIAYGVSANLIPYTWQTFRYGLAESTLPAGFVGLWLLTTPNPEPRVPRRDDAVRAWLRIIGSAGTALMLLPLPVFWLLVTLLKSGGYLVIPLLSIAVALLLFFHTRSIARYAATTRVLAHGPAAVAIWIAGVLLGQVLPGLSYMGVMPGRNQQYPVAPEVLGALVGVGGAAYAIWVLLSLRRDLHEIAKHAQKGHGNPAA